MDNLKTIYSRKEEPQHNLRAPPVNYAFNNLIHCFAAEINGDDVEVIKRLFEGGILCSAVKVLRTD